MKIILKQFKLFKIKRLMYKTINYCKINITSNQKIIIFYNKKLVN